MNCLQLLKKTRFTSINSFQTCTPRFSIMDSTNIEKICHELKKNNQPAKAYLKEFIFLCVQGTKDVWYDSKWLLKLRKEKKPHFYTAYEMKKAAIISFDLIKFIPFSFFIFVPFAELLLPPYLLLFPNSFPTQYQFDHQWSKYVKGLEEKQATSQQFLLQLLNTYLQKKGVSTSELSNNPANYSQILLKNIDELDRALNYEDLDSDQLIQVLNFLAVDFIQGTYMLKTLINTTINLPMYIANLVLWISKQKKRFTTFDFNIKMNFWKFELLKRKLLIFQINRQLTAIRNQDLQFQSYGFNDINKTNITDFIRERGLTNLTDFEDQKSALVNQWIDFSLKRIYSNNKLLWYSIANYESTKKPQQPPKGN